MANHSRSPCPIDRRSKAPTHCCRFLGLAGLLLAWCVATCGCRTLSKQGPVSQSVANCRQLTQQGINATERGDWKRAETLLARAVEMSKTDADARRHYAETLWHRGAMPEALQQLNEARRLTSEDPGLAVRTGELHLALLQVNDATRLADEALRLDPKFAAAWALRGRVAAATGQPRQALANFQRALGYAPEDHELTILVAETYRQLNEPERALAALQSLADNYTPGDEPQQVLYLEGLAMMALRRYDDATRSLSQAANRDRPTPEILYRLAEAEMLNGRVGEAQNTLQEVLALAPDHAPSRALQARMAMATPAGAAAVR
jgi:tetratricopeptide (TPR) repeat protein